MKAEKGKTRRSNSRMNCIGGVILGELESSKLAKEYAEKMKTVPIYYSRWLNETPCARSTSSRLGNQVPDDSNGESNPDQVIKRYHYQGKNEKTKKANADLHYLKSHRNSRDIWMCFFCTL
jgi:hypothetical protein